MTFADRLNEIMELRGLKAAQVAELTNTPPPQISRYLNGVHVPKMEARIRIAKGLNVPIETFIDFDDDQSYDEGWVRLHAAYQQIPEARRWAVVEFAEFVQQRGAV